ncbi:MAG TPA: hypothetical protein VGM18_02640 [Candidatus Sulfotelmatobacter sp.]|jgi:hypothetical protein
MTPNLLDADSRASTQLKPGRSVEIAAACQAILADLEASLKTSQLALLGRDASALAECTREQIRLQRSLDMLWPRNGKASCDVGFDFSLIPGLRAAVARVLHLGRVQAALLARAQCWLSTLSNLLAGPAANYAPPRGHWMAMASTPASNTSGCVKGSAALMAEGLPCQD